MDSRSADPGRTTVEYAEDHDEDHEVQRIVMGNARRGVERLLAGSVDDHVVDRDPVPAPIVR